MQSFYARPLRSLAGLALMGALLAGCPPVVPPGGGGTGGGLDVVPPAGGGLGQAEYDRGFNAGFLRDDLYFQGFDDSFDTVDGGTIFYQGSTIPFLETIGFDAGYFDGTWVAYNDGYFVSYDNAFTVGWSEGYTLFYTADWPALLADDAHVEWLDGGFTDGYNDGFSEGRIFGAFDFANGLPNDWVDALLDYRLNLTDVAVGNPPVSTGVNGPVFLYEYGTDPFDIIDFGQSAAGVRLQSVTAALRAGRGQQTGTDDLRRPLTEDRRARLAVQPDFSPRVNGRAIPLDTTWIQRIDTLDAALSAPQAALAGGQARTP